MRCVCVILLLSLALSTTATAQESQLPLVSNDLIFEETDGVLAVEAEHFSQQDRTETRAWYVTHSKATPQVKPDGDPNHVAGASGGAYLEVLPDTRRTHGDQLIHGENFQNEPGKMAVLSYKVWINTPGRYYIWARTHSTGTEDNGLHVGIDGTWPQSGRRMQWTAKRQWYWDSKQRTQKVHTGVPGQLYLDIPQAGLHLIMFSMREDGFEFDKWLMTKQKLMPRPKGVGPATKVRKGKLPEPFPFLAAPPQLKGPQSQPPAPKISLVQPRKPNGDGGVELSGELKQWHKVTLTVDGPFAHESDNEPNPFTDYRMSVRFTHKSGTPDYIVPGYFAADGEAANSSASSGTKWRAHLSPDKSGLWTYTVSFVQGKGVALNDETGTPIKVCDQRTGVFTVALTDKQEHDFRRKGRLTYVGKHHLRFAGTGEYFLKAGPDAPETLLGYADFDGTVARKKNVPLKTWKPHFKDWREGDPTWKQNKGKGLIGALNYLAEKGCNVFSFLPYNAGGDGDNVWPFVSHDDKFHYDCSKLDQWQIVFDHATARGLYLHFKLQEQEIDDNRKGHKTETGNVPTSLDNGDLGLERKLYCRELVARFGHELALNWNLGEENTQTPKQQREMAAYLRKVDPYDHHIVVHTFPDQQDKVYPHLLGKQSVLTGASLQNSWSVAHQRTLKWLRESDKAGQPWVVCNDEQGPASDGVPADPGYENHDGFAVQNGKKYNLHDVRKACLWGTLMAGGAGVEYYFGYKLPQNDLICEDFRSRDQSWDYCRHALNFFHENQIPFQDMTNADELIGNPDHNNSRYCLTKPGEVYLVYLPTGGTTTLDLSNVNGAFSVSWFNPRTGGKLSTGSVESLKGGTKVQLGLPPQDNKQDWLAVIRKK